MAAALGGRRVETLTVLFTDLVGSTDQRVRVGEEAADELRERHDRLCRTAIMTNGGTVVKHTGDGVMATFSGASEALAGAIAVQQAIDADNQRARQNGETLHVRIGISAGDVTVENDDCFGLPVVEAQRLEAAARPGQILASVLVGALSRGRGGIELQPVGPLELKGLDSPLDTVEVLWTPLSASPTATVPPGLVDRGSFPFAGRLKESELLDGAWSTVATGGTRLVLIAGEPGIGKTRLVSELAVRATDDGGAALAGRCDELVSVPYQPFVDALRWWIAQPGATDRLGPMSGELVRLVPELSSMISGLEPPLDASADAERLRLFDAVRGWLAALADQLPVLLALDDLHWADMGTLLLVRHLVANDPVPRLLVTATYRDTDLDRRHPLASMLADFRRRSDVTRVSLDGLDAGEVTDLLTKAAAHELEAEGVGLALALQQETGGNPFFVGEVVRHLAESGAIVHRDGRWTASDGASTELLPEGIRDVVGRRLSVLPDETQQALRTAAVIGTKFSLDLLAAVTGNDEDAVLDAIEPALDAHLLVEGGIAEYQFAHALVRSTLHGELSTTRRARLHRSVAQALAALHPDSDDVVADLAYHWSEAGAASAPEEAITYSVRAGELAFERSSPDEAVRWYRQARDLLDGADPSLDAELLCRLAVAELMASDPQWETTVLESVRAAEALGDVDRMVRALQVTKRGVFIETPPSGVAPERIELLERALAMAGDDKSVRIQVLAMLAVETMFTGDLARRDAYIAEVDLMLETVDDPLERFRAHRSLDGSRPLTRYSRAEMGEHIEEGKVVADLAHAAGDWSTESVALRNLFYGSLVVGSPAWRKWTGRTERLLEQYPHPLLEGHVLTARMMTALLDGDPVAVRAWAEEIGRVAVRRDMPDGTIYSGSGLIQAARETVGAGVLVEGIRSLPRDPTGRPDVNSALLALALLDTGDVGGALDIIDERGRNEFADLPDEATVPVTRALWTDVAVRTGHAASWAALYELLRPKADTHLVTGGWYLGSNTHYLGMLSSALGDVTESDQWFGRAVAEHEEVDSPTWIARTLVEWAEALLARNDVVAAHERAQRALAVIGELQLDASRSRAERVLSSS